MGIFGSIFGKKASTVKQELAKVENRDLMEAIVAGAILVTYADGECEEAELAKMEQVISALPELSHFGSEISETIGRFQSILEAGFRLGKLKVMKELEDIKGSDEDRQLVFNVILTIAEADGEIEDAEVKVLKEVGHRLGINLREYDLENA